MRMGEGIEGMFHGIAVINRGIQTTEELVGLLLLRLNFDYFSQATYTLNKM